MSQMTLALDPGVTVHPSLKACVAAGIYSRGIVSIAGKIDASPIQYLVAKFLRDPAIGQAEALQRLVGIAETLPALIAQAGLATSRKRA